MTNAQKTMLLLLGQEQLEAEEQKPNLNPVEKELLSFFDALLTNAVNRHLAASVTGPIAIAATAAPASEPVVSAG